MAAKPTFPLRKGHFEQINLSDDTINDYQSLVAKQIDVVLKKELDFVHGNKRDTVKKWQKASRKHGFQLYRSTAKSIGSKTGAHRATVPGYGNVEGSLDDILYGWYNQSNEDIKAAMISTLKPLPTTTSKILDATQPSLLAVGCVEGVLDELLFGWYAPSHEDLHATLPFMGKSVADAAVLTTIDSPTVDDPFKYVGLKWQLVKSSVLVPRDLCYIDAMGVGVDKRGERYGYVIIHSIDLPSCPPFNSTLAIRAQASFSFILRQGDNSIINIFCLGHADAGGEMVEGLQFVNIITQDVLGRMASAARCGLAKKITLVGTRSSALRRYHRQVKAQTEGDRCAVCENKKSKTVFGSWKSCQICKSRICRKCVTKHTLFISQNRILADAECCLRCIIRARQLNVNPAHPQASMATYVRLRRPPTSLGETISLDHDARSENPTMYWMESIEFHKYDEIVRSPGEVSHSVGPWDVCEEEDGGGTKNSSFLSSSSDNDRYTTSSLSVSSTDDLFMRLSLTSDAHDRYSTASWMSEVDLEATVEILVREKLKQNRQLEQEKELSQSSSIHVDNNQTNAHQPSLFQRLVALHSQSKEVEAITRANDEMMQHINIRADDGDAIKSESCPT